jgi:hypothetical protein
MGQYQITVRNLLTLVMGTLVETMAHVMEVHAPVPMVIVDLHVVCHQIHVYTQQR